VLYHEKLLRFSRDGAWLWLVTLRPQRNIERRTCGISWAMRDILDTVSSREWLAAKVFNDTPEQTSRYKNSVEPGRLVLGKL